MGFWKLGKKAKGYVETKANMEFDEHADPAVQLQQAMTQASEQQRDLKAKAAVVLAGQSQAEMRLHRAMDAMEAAEKSAKTALVMADREVDPTKKDQYNQAAMAYANKLTALKAEVEADKAQVVATTNAAQRAHEAVQTNSAAMQKRIADMHKLTSQLDQAKMQEAMNSTMADLTSTANEVVPTMDEVQAKIEARYAKALGVADLATDDTDTAMAEIDHAQTNMEAEMALSEMRTQLGLSSGTTNPAVTPLASA